MKKLTLVGTVFTLGLFALGSFFINKAEAQEGCGVIVAPKYFFDFPSSLSNDDLDTKSIENCENPFDEDLIPSSPYTLKVEGEEVISGGSISVPVGGTNQIEIIGAPHLSDKENFLFKHVDGDLVFVEHKAPEMDLPDYLDYIDVYFSNPSEQDLYREVTIGEFSGEGADALLYDEETGDYILDSEGREILFRYYEFLDSADANAQKPAPKITAGTYTMVTKEMLVILISRQSAWDKIREFLIPTAHAEDLPPQLTHTITFTIVEGVGEIKPSVLFLPGIMGSNLYEESDECNFFGGADEVKRWVSLYDCDVERLVMDENGVSINNLYTKTEDGVVEDVFLVSNLYDSFIEELAELKEENKIADYRAIPYDWRLRLGDILKTINTGGRITLDNDASYQDGYIYKSLEALVEASPNKKVVLVGHSNGGLVIKTLLATMKEENDPLLDSIEKVVLVAVPQAGTPEAVVGMLHGVEIGLAGVAVDQVQSRQLINTAPFGYHLLPAEDYFEMVETPVITIESGTSTDVWRGQFGAEIDTLIELKYFLEKESGRPIPAWEDTYTPATAYSSLINYAMGAHGFMNDWKPEDTLVYEVAGTGIDTPANITYFTDTECIRHEFESGWSTKCAETSAKFGYRINTVVDGDGTVVVPSALVGGSEKRYVDLERYNRDSIDRKHKNIFEVPSLVGLVSEIASGGTIGSYEFISDTKIEYEGKKRLVYQLHSPLDLYVVLSDGEVVGSSTPYLRGVQYSRYGEVQYLSIPESETDYEIRLDGLATGSFTLDIEEYEGNDMQERTTYSAIPSSTSTKVSIKVEEDEGVVLEIDYQGDGIYEAIALPGLAAIQAVSLPATTTPAVPEKKSGSSSTKVGLKNLLPVPTGELSSAVVITNERELLLKLIQLLTEYRDLLMKAKVQ